MSQGMIHGNSASFCLQTKTTPFTKNHIRPNLSFFSTNKTPSRRPSHVNYVGIYRTRATAVKDLFNETYEEKTMNLYELLGVSESVSFAEMKKAHKQLALKLHPDLSPPEKAEEFTMKFIQVQEAYETLSDPQARALYDKDLANGLNLPFSTRRRFHHGQTYEGRNNWESQLIGLQKRSARHTSWAAQMRGQNTERTHSEFE